MSQRLLFAAARGARIQALDGCLGWILSSRVPLALSNDKRPYRIHPDDVDLAYGPISTELREMANSEDLMMSPSIQNFVGAVLTATGFHGPWFHTWAISTPFERSLALTLLAEYCSYEGL